MRVTRLSQVDRITSTSKTSSGVALAAPGFGLVYIGSPGNAQLIRIGSTGADPAIEVYTG